MRTQLLYLVVLLAGARELAAAGCTVDRCLDALHSTRVFRHPPTARSSCSTFTKGSTTEPTTVASYFNENCGRNRDGDLHRRISITAVIAGVAAPSATQTTKPTAACAAVSSLWAAQVGAVATPTVAAGLAYDCLSSIPLHKDAAVQLVQAIGPYLEWQSDAAYKAHAPSDYYYPSYDMFDALAKVKENLESDGYENEYAFQVDLYLSVIAPGHDGHFVFYPDALTRVFEWTRPLSLVSVSLDGESLPVVMVYEDVISQPQQASAVKLINGVDVSRYLQETIDMATYNHDADAAYNSMFFEVANFAISDTKGYFADGGRIRYVYQGPDTTLTFKNGTILAVENKATVKAAMTGVVDGETFYSTFCDTERFVVADIPKSAAAGDPLAAAGYPKPVMATRDGAVSGYYLDGDGFENVAVIAVLSFESVLPSEFQTVCADFFAEAVAAGKTRLVVDFQGNGGGYILQGHDFYRQLFPHIQEDGYGRWKSNAAYMAIARAFSDKVDGLDPRTSDDAQAIADYENWFNYRYDLNLTNGNFLSFGEKFGPRMEYGTAYTALMRWNLNDPLTTVNGTYGIGMEISGYGSLANLSQPFGPENIVLLYDGVCASTCALASEMLRIQGGVKSVAMGGRPEEGPIQGVGGVKGSQVLQFGDIYSYASRALSMTTDPEKRAVLEHYSDLPIRRSSAAAVNVRDLILRDHVHDGLPAQFVFEEADCRLYWTPPMITDVSEVWKAAAGAAFNGAECVYGGISRQAGESRLVAADRNPGTIANARRRRSISDGTDQRVSDSVRSQQSWMAMHEQKVVP